MKATNKLVSSWVQIKWAFNIHYAMYTPVVNFFGENLDFPNIKNLTRFVLMFLN